MTHLDHVKPYIHTWSPPVDFDHRAQLMSLLKKYFYKLYRTILFFHKNLLNKYEIKSKLISNHKFNEKKNISKILGFLKDGFIISLICISWSIFQLWIASDFPFYLSEKTNLNLVFNSQEARQIHLAFGLSLGLLAYPVINKINPMVDRSSQILLAILGASACLYLYIFKLDISDRA